MPDYDQLPLTELRHRVRSLEEGQLRTLFDHETEHGNRIPVLEILHARSEGTARRRGAVRRRSGERTRGDTDAQAGSPVSRVDRGRADTPLRHGDAGQTPSRGKP